MAYRLGIDVGGTFTDLVLYDGDSGRLIVEKVPSVPADPSEGILDGVRKILTGAGISPADIDYLAHGTTVATNTLLQRNGARTALVTTRGFRDLLEIARQRRPSLYDLHAAKPVALVERALRREAVERVMADGTIRTALDLDEVDELLARLQTESVEALAVCFLYSFLRPEHERAVVDRARRRFPDLAISASHEVLPEFREYERLSTTVANAYLTPRMAAYVRAFRHRVESLGIRAAPYINQSNGGTISVDEAARAPVRTVLSGPSAGVAGAAWLAARAGLPSIATFDMGGTSTDVSFVQDATPRLAFEREIAGVPLRVPALDIHTVGAGGGSIAWRDSGGALKVGPASAGADPGPVCYGRGGTAATVTDANLLLGRLSPLGLLGGAVPLDVEGARRALASLGDSLGLSPLDTAVGILAVVNANMAHAIRKVTVERGVDPADLALFAFGGAGPLHAAELARELGIPTIVIPPSPGLLCALGLLVEDLRTDLVRTWVGLLEPHALFPLGAIFAELEREATAWLDRERVPRERRSLERLLDMRYAGQNYELLVPVPEETWTEHPAGRAGRTGAGAPGARGEHPVDALRRRFLERHETVYGFAAADEPIQIVNARLVARGVPEPPEVRREKAGPSDATEARTGQRALWVDGERGFVDAPVYDRARLRAGHRLSGPAIVDQFDSTTVLLAGQRGEVDELGFVVVTESPWKRLNRVTLEVIGAALLTIAEEMGTALIRASYSSNIKERWDCSTAIFDERGRVIAQAEHIPMHLGSMLGTVEQIIVRYPVAQLAAGDIFIANDPYTGGGTHLPDINLVAPVFADGALFGYVANIAHHADRTGERIRTIWDEGLRIPPIRLVERGVVREDVMELLLTNFTLPDQRRGDFRAQVAANRLGERRLLDLIARYGAATVRAACEESLAYGERKIRAAIASLPDGIYRFLDHMDDDGVQRDPIPISVAIAVAGDSMHLDFTGSGPQVAGDLNVVYGALQATVYYALKAVLDPSIPANGGFYRAITVTAPEGSIVNARPPAPVAWRTQTCQRIADVIFGALAAVVPERVPAAGNGANSAMVFSGTDPRTGRYYIYLETIGGGAGATAHADGLDGVQVHITNTSNLPVECLEMEYPLLVAEYSLVEGSGGAGQYRGGLGIRRTIEILGHDARFLGTLDRARIAPWGLQGGEPGGCGSIVLNAGTSREILLPSKVWGLALSAGDCVAMTTPGAGGYGRPAERAPSLIEQDLRNGVT